MTLQSRLDRLGLTQRATSRMIAVDERTLRGWTTGRSRCPAAVLMLLDLVAETAARTGEAPVAVLERLRAGVMAGA